MPLDCVAFPPQGRYIFVLTFKRQRHVLPLLHCSVLFLLGAGFLRSYLKVGNFLCRGSLSVTSLLLPLLGFTEVLQLVLSLAVHFLK